MTINRLKELLDYLIKEGHGELEVLLSKDAEGNGFNGVDDITVNHCYENDPIHPDDIGTEYNEEDLEVKSIIWSE
ncbi:hypothetical protein WKH57_01315 [Niallia taxi]|uniref:hypothetical protein n=1 Tax=Niallia taxi TaxID=2499688 RepID=UPI0031829475